MVSFQTFFLEYAHNMADGTPKITMYASNKKGSRDIAKPNDMTRKYVTTKGPYKPLNAKVHKLGYVFAGNELTDVLVTYNLEFKDGKISKIKNSPYALQMFVTPQGNKAQVIQVK
jgi:hypothetical protein